MRVDDHGWLVAEAGDPALTLYPSERTSTLSVPAPLGVVWHWTGLIGDPQALAKRVQGYDPARDRAASWHLLIARDGAIYQSAACTRATWHVGRPGEIAGRQWASVNRCTVGVELENAGRLRKVGPIALARVGIGWRRVDAARASRVQGVGWFDAYPLAQERSATAVIAALVERYGWHREVCSYGHRDFDPARKEDPGPLWAAALPRVIDAAFSAALEV